MRADRIVESRVAQGDGARLAFVLDDGTSFTYEALAGRIGSAAAALAGAGLRAGDRAALIGENSADMVVALFGAMRVGAWAVPLNARMSADEIDGILLHGEPRIVYLASGSSAEAAVHAARLHATPAPAALAAGMLQVRGGEAAGTTDAPDRVTGGDGDVALMLYTSGSTGTPKGVMLTHATLDFVTDLSRRQGVMGPGDVVYHALPISHSFGLISSLLCGLRSGATFRLARRFSAQALGQAIIDREVTVFMGVPAMYARLHEWAAQTGRALVPNSLRMIYIGGALLDPARKAQTEALLGLPLHNGYGLTETAPIVSRTFGHPPRADVTTGWPVAGIEVEIRDPQGRVLAPGEAGEVCVRGPNVMKGYFRDPEQTRAALDEQGWLHTGDIGVFGPAGDLSIVGRIKELIVRSGFNVYPSEVEKAIAAHPDVAQCAVVGRRVPDNEEVVAYVEPLAGRDFDVDGLRAFLRGRLAPYKMPGAIHVMARLPASGTGKILKARLKALAAGQEEAGES